MSHAELIHFPLEVPFRTQRRSERSLLGVPLQERGRAAVDFPIFALTSFMQQKCICIHVMVPHFSKTLHLCLKIQFPGSERRVFLPIGNHNQESLLFLHSPPSTTRSLLHALSSVQVGTGCWSGMMNFATHPERVQELTFVICTC